MPTNLQRDLKKKRRSMVQLVRSAVGMSNMFGFVMDATDNLVLVHLIVCVWPKTDFILFSRTERRNSTAGASDSIEPADS